MLRYELGKLFGTKFAAAAILLLAAANCVIIFISNKGAAESASAITSDLMSDVIADYVSSPDALEEYYDDVKQLLYDQQQMSGDLAGSGEGYEPVPLPMRYSQDESVSDLDLLSELFLRVDYIRGFKPDIARTIAAAELGLDDLEGGNISRSSYAWRYLVRLLELYGDIYDNVNLGLEYTRGWEDFFVYNTVDIFIALSIILITPAVFIGEYTAGTLSLIRSTKLGRGKLLAAKLLAYWLGCTIIVLVFMLMTFLMFGQLYGYSSPFNAIQVIGSFEFCPYRFNILTYLIIFIALKILSFSAFGGVILFVGILTYNTVASVAAGAGIYALSFFMSVFRYDDANNILKFANFVSPASGYLIFERYRAVNIFGFAVDLAPALYVILLVIFLLSLTAVGFSFCGSLRAVGSIKRTANKLTAEIPAAESGTANIPTTRRKQERGRMNRRRSRNFGLSITRWELYKYFLSSRLSLVVMLLFVIKLWLLYNAEDLSESYQDSVYREYMTRLSGEYTDEKREYLTAERDYIDEILNMKHEYDAKYFDGEITFDVYNEYLEKYYLSYSRFPALKKAEAQAAYIDELAAQGIQASFVYDTGWKELFSAGFDWTLLAAIIVLLSDAFGVEYGGRSSAGDFAVILRTAKRGRGKTLTRKYLAALISAGALSAVWILSEAVRIAICYELPAANAPILSLQTMRGFADNSIYDCIHNVSIYQFYIIYVIVRIFFGLCAASFIVSLSAIFKKPLIVSAAAAALTLLPFCLERFGVTLLAAFDFTDCFRATPVLLSGNVFYLYAVVIFALCVSLYLLSARRWK